MSGLGGGASELARRARWIARVWRPHRAWVLVLFVMTFVSAGVTLAYPLVLGHVLEVLRRELTPLLAGAAGAAGAGDAAATVATTVSRVVWVLLAIGLARWVAALYPGLRALVNAKLERDVRERTFARLLPKGHRFFARFRTGDLITRLTDDVAGYPKIAWFCCSGLFRALDSGTRVVVCLAVMLWLDRALALWTLLPVPAMVAVYLALHRGLGRATSAQRAEASATSDLLEAAFSGVTTVQAHAAGPRLERALARQLARRADAEVRLNRLWVLLGVFFQALNVVGQLVVVVVGGLRVIDGTLALGDFFAFYLYLGLLLGPMMDLPNLLVTGRQAFVCMDRLDAIDGYDRAGEGGAFARTGGAAPAGPGVTVRGVTHAWDELPQGPAPGDEGAAPEGQVGAGARRPALEDVSLEVAPGEVVALVGAIGAGKSTLARVVGGAVAPDAGEVTLGGAPLAALDGPRARASIGWVPQDPVLLAATVRENILLGRPDDPARLAEVLDLVGLAAEVAALPGGLDHALGPRGRGLSGGQRQRLALARALYGRPELLVLDDVTAALDAENEDRLWRRLREGGRRPTALVVTHRDATAARADRVVQLERGRVCAAGRHAELLARDDAVGAEYRALWAREGDGAAG